MLGELSPQQIETLLQEEFIGRIGCHAEGRTYVVPVSYVYDGKTLIAHSPEGMKLRMMRENPEVCFEVDRMQNMTNWQSVIAWGRFEELSGEEARQALLTLARRLQPHMPRGHALSESAHPPPHPEAQPVRMPVLYRIRLHEKTGRYESSTTPHVE